MAGVRPRPRSDNAPRRWRFFSQVPRVYRRIDKTVAALCPANNAPPRTFHSLFLFLSFTLRYVHLSVQPRPPRGKRPSFHRNDHCFSLAYLYTCGSTRPPAAPTTCSSLRCSGTAASCTRRNHSAKQMTKKKGVVFRWRKLMKISPRSTGS